MFLNSTYAVNEVLIKGISVQSNKIAVPVLAIKFNNQFEVISDNLF
ncbi:hypothetical protein TGS27_2794 [Geobacillus stearothermophilus]|nr:hypothetical protein TGS27_2794 [Geobacillus stearothermophilus]